MQILAALAAVWAFVQRYAVWIALGAVVLALAAAGLAIHFYTEIPPATPLAIPAQMQVQVGYPIHVQAETPESQVLWHACGGNNLNLQTLPAPDGKSALLIAHQAGTFHLHAIVSHKGKAHFATCQVTVGDGPPGPGPNPPVPPVPPQPRPSSPLHVTIVVDEANETAATAALIGSSTVRQKLAAAGHKLRVYNQSSPTLSAKGLSPLVTACGAPCVIFQTNDGRAIPDGKAQKLPATEADFLTLLSQAGG